MHRLVSIDGDPAALDRIARPDVALAIWWRALSRPMQIGLAALDLDAVDDVAIDLHIEDSTTDALRSAGYGAVLTMLACDIDHLVRRHAALTGEDVLGVRLTVLESDGARFEADKGTFQLSCTYVGPGTQWCCVDGEDAICEIPTGAVGVFKGRTLLNPPAVLRRSPPFGGLRLVLTIDPVRPRDPA